MRWLRRLAWTVGAVVIMIGLGTLVPRPFFSTVPDEPATRRIWVLSNPIHTDIAVPVDDELRARFGFLAKSGLPLDAPGLEYLVFGWGGREFYLQTPNWSELKLGPLLKGLTLDRAAMHVSLYGPISPAEYAMPIEIGEAGYASLVDYIRDSFQDASGEPVHISGSGYGEFDTFYEANGRFTALLGCNSWTAGGLRSAGIRTGFWNPLPALLRTSLRLHSR